MTTNKFEEELRWLCSLQSLVSTNYLRKDRDETKHEQLVERRDNQFQKVLSLYEIAREDAPQA